MVSSLPEGSTFVESRPVPHGHPVPADEACRDLVNGPVQVVDPALERDGEVDEVALAAAEQHLLACLQAPHAKPDPGGHQERNDCRYRRADRDPGGSRR